MKSSSIQKADKIKQFAELCQQGIDAWTKAGEILIELVEDDPKVFDKIIDFDPRLTAGILGRFEQMGRKVLHPQLLLNDSPGLEKLAQMPYSVQERFLSESIPLVIEDANGTDILMVNAKNCTSGQARQIFGKGHIRTEGEQKAWLMQQRSNLARPVVSKPWTIKANKIIINGVEFSRKELAGMLAQMD